MRKRRGNPPPSQILNPHQKVPNFPKGDPKSRPPPLSRESRMDGTQFLESPMGRFLS